MWEENVLMLKEKKFTEQNKGSKKILKGKGLDWKGKKLDSFTARKKRPK
jgi:hypothetical protein